MITVILTIHVLIVLTLIGIVLLQRSEGGALGMGGGGGGGGGFMTSRGAANALTRTTSVLAALFFATSISLALLADRGESEVDVIEDLTGERVADPNAPISTDDLTRTLGSDSDDEPTGTESGDLDLSGALGAPAEDVSVEDALDALGAETETPAETEPVEETPPAEEEPQEDPNP